MIAFSTDSSVAGRGVYLLSFLPESDVNRIVDYSAGIGKRSFAALLPDNAYGNVVEAAFKQAVGRKADASSRSRNMAPIAPARRGRWRSRSARPMRCSSPTTAIRWWRRPMRLTAAGANLRNIQLLGTGLWDNPRVFASPVLQGGLYAAPDPSGFPRFLRPLSRQIWRRPRAHRDAGL